MNDTRLRHELANQAKSIVMNAGNHVASEGAFSDVYAISLSQNVIICYAVYGNCVSDPTGSSTIRVWHNDELVLKVRFADCVADGADYIYIHGEWEQVIKEKYNEV